MPMAMSQRGQDMANFCSIPNEFLDVAHEMRDYWKSVKKTWSDRPGVGALRNVEGAALPRDQCHDSDNSFAKLCGEDGHGLKPILMLEGPQVRREPLGEQELA